MIQEYTSLAQVVEQVLNEAEHLARHVELLYRLAFSKETLYNRDIQELKTYRSNAVDLLTQLRNVNIHEPQEERLTIEWETYRRIQKVGKTAEETIKRLIAVEVLIDFALQRQDQPDAEEQMEYAHLSVLGYLNGLAMRAAEHLDSLHMQELENWPALREQDDEEEEFTNLPEELDSFQQLRMALESGLELYSVEHPSDELASFRKALTAYLDAFSKGIEPEDGLQFSFSIRGEGTNDTGMQYLSFNLEIELMEISSGGSVYDPEVGSDSYTNWMYCLGINGWEDNTDCHDLSDLPELIGSGALLSVDYPDELLFSDNSRDDN